MTSRKQGYYFGTIPNYCSSTMLVQVKWKDRSLSVPLSQLELDEESDDEDTLQAIGDWEYWVESGRAF